MIINTATKEILSTATTKGRVHDFRIFKESRPLTRTTTTILGDTGYQGIHKLHRAATIPRKKNKGSELSRDDKRFNHEHSSIRIEIEHVIGSLKKFRIIADRYRNRRRRFGLRFKLIAGWYNYELPG